TTSIFSHLYILSFLRYALPLAPHSFPTRRSSDLMFWVAGELFGFTFTPVTDVPVYHPDVRVWEVTDKASGRHVGLWYFDPYARRSEEHTSELQSRENLVCRLLLEKKKQAYRLLTE